MSTLMLATLIKRYIGAKPRLFPRFGLDVWCSGINPVASMKECDVLGSFMPAGLVREPLSGWGGKHALGYSPRDSRATIRSFGREGKERPIGSGCPVLDFGIWRLNALVLRFVRSVEGAVVAILRSVGLIRGVVLFDESGTRHPRWSLPATGTLFRIGGRVPTRPRGDDTQK